MIGVSGVLFACSCAMDTMLLKAFPKPLPKLLLGQLSKRLLNTAAQTDLANIRREIEYTRAFIKNEYVDAAGGKAFSTINPSTGKEICKISACSAEDVKHAVAAAREAFEGPQWGLASSGRQRAHVLSAMATIMQAEKERLAWLETLDMGKPLTDARADVDGVVSIFRYYSKLAHELDAKQGQEIKVADGNFATALYREPVGVVGCITPWNYPLLMSAQKVAAALAAGCTVVLKPSELAPLTSLSLGDISARAGLPSGALNIVPGMGVDAGQPLVEHPDVDKVSFTGSVPTGVRIMKTAADRVKGVSLELGGKSAMIVCADADIKATVDWVLVGIFQNTGQICSATSRLLVHEHVYDQLVGEIVKKAQELKVGDPLGPKGDIVKVGPVVSEGQMKKVLGFIERAKAQGATLSAGGARPENVPEGGFYVAPTIFTGVRPEMEIWREEVFGPVLAVTSYLHEDEAIRLTNDTPFGLAASVMSRDRATTRRIAKRLRAGVVWENCSQPAFVEAPWGGMGQSGLGRELGEAGLDEYLEVKQVTGPRDSSYTWGWAV